MNTINNTSVILQAVRRLLLSPLLPLAATLVCATEANAQRLRLAPPLPPAVAVAVPDYSLGVIALAWSDSSRNETGFQVERSVGGGAWVRIANLPAGTRSATDAAVVPGAQYRYRVRAVNAAGASAFASTGRQNLDTVWPVPTSHEVLHGWNDTLGSAAVDENGAVTGFHMGVDIQRVAATEDVVAVRGGQVIQANVPANGNGVVVIRTFEGAGTKLFQTNHLHRLTVAPNQIVYAGQKIGEIATEYFPANFTDHTHYVITAESYHTLPAHPLAVFSAAADRDPKEKRPGFAHHAGSPAGTVLYQREGAAADTYLTVDATHPLEGDVDIIIEFGDEQGLFPDQVPTRLGYWIEKPPMTCGVTYHDVKGAPGFYLLFAWESAYFGDAPGAAFLSEEIVNTGQDSGFPNIAWPTGDPLIPFEFYPWPNYKHFTVTNTTGTDGLPSRVDPEQHWNTNAFDDSASDGGPHANYAGFPDTTRASMARFPDGVYTIHVVANDLIQDAGAFLEIPVRLENFNPIVCMTDPPHGEVMPADIQALAFATVTFNEKMDTSVPPATIVSVDNGATLTGATWMGDVTIAFSLSNLQNGQTYHLSVSPAAKDLPGTPGGRPLDGNGDGVGGDAYVATFSVAPGP